MSGHSKMVGQNNSYMHFLKYADVIGAKIEDVYFVDRELVNEYQHRDIILVLSSKKSFVMPTRLNFSKDGEVLIPLLDFACVASSATLQARDSKLESCIIKIVESINYGFGLVLDSGLYVFLGYSMKDVGIMQLHLNDDEIVLCENLFLPE